MTKRIPLCLVFLALHACAPADAPGDTDSQDIGSTEDTNSLPVDSGQVMDAGVGFDSDAGFGEDTGPDSGSTTVTTDAGQNGNEQTGPATNFSVNGPFAVETTSSSLAVGGCNLDYDHYTPVGTTPPALVILGHGYLRKKENMAILAAHMASYGLQVAAPTYCDSAATEANAQAAVDLAASLVPSGAVIYAGHSRGGMSSMLAATLDSRATASLGLDLTDIDGVAMQAAPNLSIPALALVAEPEWCNAESNGIAVYAQAPNASVINCGGQPL